MAKFIKAPTGNRRQLQKLETRALILKIANAHFEQKGYAKTTMRGVAAEAGVAVGTIFSHFPDKIALLCAILYHDLESEINTAIKSIPKEKPLNEQFGHFAEHFYRYWLQRVDLAKSFFIEYSFSSSNWADQFEQQIQLFLKYFVDRLEEMKQEGLIKPNSNCQIAITSFWAHYITVLIFELKNKTPDLNRMMTLLNQMNQQTLEGILT